MKTFASELNRHRLREGVTAQDVQDAVLYMMDVPLVDLISQEDLPLAVLKGIQFVELAADEEAKCLYLRDGLSPVQQTYKQRRMVRGLQTPMSNQAQFSFNINGIWLVVLSVVLGILRLSGVINLHWGLIATPLAIYAFLFIIALVAWVFSGKIASWAIEVSQRNRRM